MQARLTQFAVVVAVAFLGMLLGGAEEAPTPLQFEARHRVRESASGDQFKVVTEPLTWSPHQTAVVICDMWDHHWCKSAERRVAEMAPRVNQFVSASRDRGCLVIHCPSDTMDFYKDYPGRKLAQSAPKVDTKVPLQRWCKIDPAHGEPPLPIDDSDGGCPDEPRCKEGHLWTREIATIEIKDGDAITDSAEAFYLMKQRGIRNVLVLGVHENMCVLGRPFSIRQMVMQGMNVLLVRDLTDTMYNPRMRPFVPHERGTDLIVEHVEKYWCPSMTSDQVLGGKAFKFAEDRR
jgi:nicotinamidase-related amidase